MESMRVIKKTPNAWLVEMAAGVRIRDACALAVQTAEEEKVKVVFNFNGIPVVAVFGDGAVKLADRYNTAISQRQLLEELENAAYYSSPDTTQQSASSIEVSDTLCSEPSSPNL